MLDPIIEPLAQFVFFIVSKLGYWGVVIAMAIESACIPLPSEIILPYAGFLVSKGMFNFWIASLAGGFGCLIGSVLAYWLGAHGGEELTRKLIRKYGKYILVFEYELDEAEEWLNKHGDFITFSSRLLPVIRTFISLPAGIAKINFKKFCFYTFTGSVIWSALLIYVGKALGDNWRTIGSYFHKFDLVIILFCIGGFIWYVKHKVKKHKKRKQNKTLKQ